MRTSHNAQPFSPGKRRRLTTPSHHRIETVRFNRRHPVGTAVRYWPGAIEGEGRLGETRSDAFLLEGHTAVVFVTGYPAAISLSHIEVVGESVQSCSS